MISSILHTRLRFVPMFRCTVGFSGVDSWIIALYLVTLYFSVIVTL